MKAAVAQIASQIQDYFAKPILVACFFVLVALLWTFLLQQVFAYPFVFLFFAAIMGSAWFGGLLAGFWAIVLSSLLIAFFFLPPLYSMAVAREMQTYEGAFIVSAIAIVAISVVRKRSENAVRTARDELEDRVRERTAALEQSNLEILERERQLRLVTEAIPQQVWRANADGYIEHCNQHLRAYAGKPMEQLCGEGFYRILHPEDAPLYAQGWREAVQAGERFEIEARVRGADEVYRWFLVRSIPQRAEDGNIARWYGTHIDIEELHRAQENLTVAQEDLSRLARTMSMAEMAASIAHELNQPLTAVVTHAYACREWLRDEPINLEKAATTAEKIVEESTRASAVVSHVRALFRTETLVREPTEINHLIRDLARLLRDESIRRNVSIRLQLADDLPALPMDPVQIRQLIQNLVLNGMDAMKDAQAPRELLIRTEKHGDAGLLVAVEDRGSGIAPEVASRIFEPFFSTKPEGTGMGLAICRSIVEAHDGRLWAAPAAQGGTIFQFNLKADS